MAIIKGQGYYGLYGHNGRRYNVLIKKIDNQYTISKPGKGDVLPTWTDINDIPVILFSYLKKKEMKDITQWMQEEQHEQVINEVKEDQVIK